MNPLKFFRPLLVVCLLGSSLSIHSQRNTFLVESTESARPLFVEAPQHWDANRSLLSSQVHRPSDAALMQLDIDAFQAMREADLDEARIDLPRPSGQSGVEAELLRFDLERFFVHPNILTVGITGEQGFRRGRVHPPTSNIQNEA